MNPDEEKEEWGIPEDLEEDPDTEHTVRVEDGVMIHEIRTKKK